ncbi:MAG: nucleotidyl transferase [Cyanobacteria bacterium DS2.3.42]|nr:nucleotidyl transferase [Cyanobacteria bacterium DS2.3.42]
MPENKGEALASSLAAVPVLIPAGGLAKRLKEVAKDTPKSLLDIGGEPFISHQLKLLKREGATRVVFLIGHLGDKIKEFIESADDFHMEIAYFEDGEKALGTGGCIAKVLSEVGDEFAIMYGDTYLDISIAPVYQAFIASGMPGLMTVLENNPDNNNQWEVSNVEFDRQGAKIVAYDKKKPTEAMQHIDFGLSFFRKSAFDSFRKKKSFDLGLVFQDLARAGKLAGYEVHRRFYDLNTQERLIETRAYLSQNKLWQFD